MRTRIDRRTFVRSTTAAALGATLPLRLLHAQSTARGIGVVELTDDMIVIMGAGANICALQNDNALLLVDGGAREHASAVLAALDQWSGGKPVDIMFNTNWRPDHTGLNEVLAARGTRILAHENTRLWMTVPFDVDWESAHYDVRPVGERPNETFYVGGDLSFGDLAVHYDYHPQAHTDGDISVYFPHRDLLVASDLLAVGRYPVLDYATGGWIGGLEQALESMIAATRPQTRVVPAVGPVQVQTALTRELEMCRHVREAVRDAYRNGRTAAEFYASEPTAGYDAERGDPTMFLQLAFKGTWPHVRELGAGII
jgi:glyoxylase-like metal-dependent hydrolase (beta-lactamase superfamily II)